MQRITEEFIPEDRWKQLPTKEGFLFRFHNPAQASIIWCKKENSQLLCFENSMLRNSLEREEEAFSWAKDIMFDSSFFKPNKPIIESLVYDSSDINSYSELSSISQGIKDFMKKFQIGWKIKSFKDEKGATKKTRDLIQKWIQAEPDKRPTPGQFKQKLKDEIVKYDTIGRPNIKDYEIERVARTELSSSRTLLQLLKWKEQGYKEVRHITHFSKNTGEKDKRFNGRIFKIDYLLTHPEDRVPLHPNCRCNYTLYQ